MRFLVFVLVCVGFFARSLACTSFGRARLLVEGGRCDVVAQGFTQERRVQTRSCRGEIFVI